MIKIVINCCFGGFGLSKKAIEEYAKKKNIDIGEYNQQWGYYDAFYYHDIPRDDPVLIEIVESLGEESFGRYAELKVVEIPGDVKWEIVEWDGKEHIRESSRTWS